MHILLEILNKSTEYLESKGVSNAKHDTQELIAYALGIPKMEIFLKYDKPLAEEELSKIRPLIKRRADREPLQHIIGETGFRNLDLKCDKRALIPRPDTEGIVDLALKYLGKNSSQNIVDIGTGTGAIILSMVQEAPGHQYHAIDISEDALSLAKENEEKNGLIGSVSWHCSDIFDKYQGKQFDLVLSNPPYINRDVIQELDIEVKDYDPKLALDGGESGLDFYEKFFETATPFLKHRAVILFEIGYDQKEKLRTLLSAHHAFAYLECKKDYGGQDRFVICEFQGS